MPPPDAQAPAHHSAPNGAERKQARGSGPDLGKYDLSFWGVLRVYAYFFRFIKPYLPQLILVAALMFVQIPAGQLSLFLVRDVTDQVLLAVDKPSDARMTQLVQILLIQAGLWALGSSLWKLREIMNWYCFMRGTLDLRLSYVEHLHKLPLAWLRKRAPGEHLFRATSDMMSNHNDPFDAGLMGMIAWTVLPIAETLYTLAWTTIILWFIEPWLGVVATLYIVPYWIVHHVMIGLQRVAGHQNAALGTLETGVLRDSIGGMRSLHAMGKTLRQRAVYTKVAVAQRRAHLKFTWIGTTTGDAALWGVRWLYSSALYMWLAIQVVKGEATVGEFLATFALFEAARGPIESLVGALQSIRIWTINGQRVMQTLTVPPTLVDPEEAAPLGSVEGRIEFQDVALEYEPGRPALQGVSLVVEPGESVAFVGPSGAGKSSIISLLLRLYAPTSGRVLVDGADLAKVKIDSLIEQTALVPQTTFLYDGSLRDNLQFGRLRAPDDELLGALDRAGAGPLMSRLPDGLDYPVGEALTLSGGERQRIGIARALVRAPKILILDEATANLDGATEEQVLRTLEGLYEGRTVLVVAHRLKAAAGCSRIVVLDHGRIAAQGSHASLLEGCAWYRERWQEQQEEGRSG